MIHFFLLFFLFGILCASGYCADHEVCDYFTVIKTYNTFMEPYSCSLLRCAGSKYLLQSQSATNILRIFTYASQVTDTEKQLWFHTMAWIHIHTDPGHVTSTLAM